ncbi:hypothetical protein B0H12DRAFT_1125011 [Mycena haematopus]|nr:hypothetical protein B0H12DRAFT_1125011 [Mycena haematopus]
MKGGTSCLPPTAMAQTDIAGYLRGWKAQTFNALPDENLQLWLCDIRYGLKQRRVPHADWVPVASHFLGPELQGVLGEVKEGIEKLEPGGWNWDRFTSSLIVIHDRVKKDAAENDPETIGAAVSRMRRDYPVQTAAAGIGLIALGGVVVGPAILIGTLKILGFHVTGIAGGSIAAGIKTAVYGGYVAGRTAVTATGPVRALSAGAMAVGGWIGFEVRPPDEVSDTVATETVTAEAIPVEDASVTPGDDKALDNSTVAVEPDNSAASIPFDVDEQAPSPAVTGNESGSNNAEPISLEGDGESAATIPAEKGPNIAVGPMSLAVDEQAPSPALTGNDSGSNNAELISLEDDESGESAATIHAEKGPDIAGGPVSLENDEQTVSDATMTGDDKSPISSRDIHTE